MKKGGLNGQNVQHLQKTPINQAATKSLILAYTTQCRESFNVFSSCMSSHPPKANSTWKIKLKWKKGKTPDKPKELKSVYKSEMSESKEKSSSPDPHTVASCI